MKEGSCLFLNSFAALLTYSLNLLKEGGSIFKLNQAA
jgi:hypothetical protein